MNKIKIAFVIDTISDQLGGTEKQLLLLLNNLDLTKFTPYLCMFKDQPLSKNMLPDIEHYYFKFDTYYSLNNWLNFFKFASFLKREKIDIVQTHFRDGMILGVIAARIAGIRNIVYARRSMQYWLIKRELFLLKLFNPFIKRVLANSLNLKAFINEVEGVPNSKIDVVYNGIDNILFHSKNNNPNAEYFKHFKIEPDSSVVVLVGNLRPVKGIDVFIKSAKYILEEISTVYFLVIGDGDEKQKLSNLAADLNIQDRIIFAGKRDDIPSILTICDIGVSSSHSEGLSNSIIEYMTSGLPVICTDVGGNNELVEENKNGYLVLPNEPKQMARALLKLLENKSLANSMGKESKKRSKENFSLKTFIQHMQKYYVGLLIDHPN